MLIQNRVQPEEVKYYSYEKFKNDGVHELVKDDVEQGAFFNLMEQQPDGTFVSRSKRFLGADYTAQVFVSTD